MTRVRALLAGLALLALGGCAGTPPALEGPALRLSPASLGAPLALQQQLTLTVAGQTHRMDLLLEADAEIVRLAVLNLGQTAARLEWDGRRLTQVSASWWPERVTAARVLDDLQLMLWPAHAITAALPAGWTLTQEAGLRVLRRGDRDVIRIRYDTPISGELEHVAAGYRVKVESRALGVAP